MSEHGYTKLAYFLIFNTKVPSTSGVFCGVRDTDKLEPLNKILFILRDARIQDMVTFVYKCLVNMTPFYVTSLF